LHLSDFHFRTNKSSQGQVEDYNRDLVLGKLLDDLRSYTQEHGIVVDFIVITGDIAFSGQEDEYNLATEFFNKLLKIFNLGVTRLIAASSKTDFSNKLVQLLL
jgi:3',5'-cyclic AMP phosphodiesterase CpdA